MSAIDDTLNRFDSRMATADEKIEALGAVLDDAANLTTELGLTTVPTEDALSGRPIGGYVVLNTNERVYWNGMQITQRAPMAATAGDVQEARDLAQQADGRAVDAQALAEQADSKAESASSVADTTQSAVNNLVLSNLQAKRQADGAQFVFGVRWLWQPTNPYLTVDHVRVTTAAGGGFWVAEINNNTLDARFFGVAEGADASTLKRAIDSTPSGWNLECPRVKLIQRDNGNKRLLEFKYPTQRNIYIYLNGLTVEADPTLEDNHWNGGFYFIGCKGWEFYDGIYDGRLDARTASGLDAANTNAKSGWNILNDCEDMLFSGCSGNRCLMDGWTQGGIDRSWAEWADAGQEHAPRNIRYINCRGAFNKRQGMSVTWSNGHLVDNCEFADTGQLGDALDPAAGNHASLNRKYTAPGAGFDSEGWIQSPFNNGLVLGGVVRNTRALRNRGMGFSIHNGTINSLTENCHAEGNGGEGFGMTWSGHGNTIRGGYSGKNQRNSNSGAEVGMSGPNQVITGMRIECERGVAALNAGYVPFADEAPFQNRSRVFSDNTIVSLDGSGGHAFMAGGTYDVMDGNTWEGATTFSGNYVRMESPGGSFQGNIIRGRGVNARAAYVQLGASGIAQNNQHGGFAGGAVYEAGGDNLPPVNVTATLTNSAQGTLSGVGVSLIARTPDTQAYRVTGVLTPAAGAGGAYSIQLPEDNGQPYIPRRMTGQIRSIKALDGATAFDLRPEQSYFSPTRFSVPVAPDGHTTAFVAVVEYSRYMGGMAQRLGGDLSMVSGRPFAVSNLKVTPDAYPHVGVPRFSISATLTFTAPPANPSDTRGETVVRVDGTGGKQIRIYDVEASAIETVSGERRQTGASWASDVGGTPSGVADTFSVRHLGPWANALDTVDVSLRVEFVE
ncbi:hypothetical protein ACXXCZ_21915 (plasmid) [Deinococcus sp. PEB2-67]